MTIKIGVLWYDRDPRKSVKDKIDEAAERHAEKFGFPPNACYVNAHAIAAHDQLRIVPRSNILPHYFLVGVDLDPEIGDSPAPPVAVLHHDSPKKSPRRRTGKGTK